MKIADNHRVLMPTGRTLARELSGIGHADAASALMLGDLPEGESTIVVLPLFALVDYDGRESLNKVSWDSPSVLLVRAGESVSAKWKVEDSSLPTTTGTLRAIGADAGNPHQVTGAAPGTYPQPDGYHLPSLVSVATQGELRRELMRISTGGRMSMFRLVDKMTQYATLAVDSAARRVFREIHDLPDDHEVSVRPVVDSVEQEAIVSRLLYGEEGQTSSIITRLLQRIACTDLAVRKSIITILARQMWSNAETLVRSAIGDPHPGRVIRRIARALSSVDPNEVLLAYRAQYPDSDVGIRRVQAALTAGETLDANRVALDVELDLGVVA